MELLLNALWLLLSVAALSWCACRQNALAPRKADTVRTVIAVSLVALFLFPVISATDDLHPAQAMVEESASKRLVFVGHALSPATAAPPIVAVAFLLLLLFSHACVIGTFRNDTPLALSPDLSSRLKDRAPPVSCW